MRSATRKNSALYELRNKDHDVSLVDKLVAPSEFKSLVQETAYKRKRNSAKRSVKQFGRDYRAASVPCPLAKSSEKYTRADAKCPRQPNYIS
jgi:hypothetical protein